MCKSLKVVEKLKCIAVVLMAHGGYGYIKCQAKKLVNGEVKLTEVKLKLSLLFDMLESCEELQDVPKIFIIEACRKGNWKLFQK